MYWNESWLVRENCSKKALSNCRILCSLSRLHLAHQLAPAPARLWRHLLLYPVRVRAAQYDARLTFAINLLYIP